MFFEIIGEDEVSGWEIFSHYRDTTMLYALQPCFGGEANTAWLLFCKSSWHVQAKKKWLCARVFRALWARNLLRICGRKRASRCLTRGPSWARAASFLIGPVLVSPASLASKLIPFRNCLRPHFSNLSTLSDSFCSLKLILDLEVAGNESDLVLWSPYS